nr:MAG TPA: hypothetical protein [Caudoviricetes sp.]
MLCKARGYSSNKNIQPNSIKAIKSINSSIFAPMFILTIKFKKNLFRSFLLFLK